MVKVVVYTLPTQEISPRPGDLCFTVTAIALWGSIVPKLTQQRLKQVLGYDPKTGIFRWKVRRPKRKPGDQAGCLNKEGYVKISVDGASYTAHRLAFFWMTGKWPTPMTDHFNGIRNNNRWENLREVTCEETVIHEQEKGDGSERR